MVERIYRTRCGEIHYWISDCLKPERGTIVFLPGLTADHRLFDKQVMYFDGKWNVLVWDAPAHAASWPFSMDFDFSDKARWLHEILESENIANPVFVGQSMGGYLGQMYLQLFPGRVAGFAVIDSAPLQKKYMTAIEIWMLKHTEGLYRMYPWKALVRDGSRGCAETEYGRNLMADMMSVYNDNPERYVKLVSHGYRMLANAVEANLPYEIGCPAILICGEKDKAGSSKTYNKKWHKCTGLPIYWIKGAGHNSNADSPEEINRILLAFIKRNGA